MVINKSSYERGFAHGCVYKGQVSFSYVVHFGVVSSPIKRFNVIYLY